MKPIDILFPGRQAVIDSGRCPTCGQPIGVFRDALSAKEFRISGMCQKCQDDVFTEEPPELPLYDDLGLLDDHIDVEEPL